MDLIYTDATGKELGFVQKANIDFEVGEDEKDSVNDFEVEFKRYDWDGMPTYGCRLFSPATEFGGIVSELATNTKSDTVTLKGYTWRGMMTKKVIQPLAGQDYAVASGELNAIIKSKVEEAFPGLFFGVTTSTEKTVGSYQFDRYCTLHDGLVAMLKSVGYKLNIEYDQGSSGKIGYVRVQAVPIVDYSNDLEFSNDNNFNFTMKDNRRGVNHLICLGKGDLKDRIVEHLYTDQNNNVSRTQFFKGVEEIVQVYDSNGSERSDLIENGTKKLEEVKNRAEYDMTMEKIEGNIDIGDIVGGRDYLTNTSITKPIGRKIWTISAGLEKLEYKLKGES